MATCKDCLYEGFCYYTVTFADRSGCKKFKNKSDFVEVVRCEKCKHGDVGIIEKTKGGQETWGCYCNIAKVVHSLDWYCPWGVRKEDV